MITPHSPRRLPPLNAVRAFEAAARHGNFTRAADELSVTQGAVSHQVRSLEEWFGFPLFERHKREVRLTQKGETYLTFVRAMLNELHSVTQMVRGKTTEESLCISVPESFAVNWLIGRLKSFTDQYPDLEVRLTSQNQIDDQGKIVGEEGSHWVNLRIRYGRAKWPGLRVTKLFDEQIFPVCSPDIAKDGLPQLGDLANHTLIHDDMQMSWSSWLRSVGEEHVVLGPGPSFSHSHMALQAAENGLGIALARGVLAHDYLARGALVRPFEASVPAEHGYYLLCQERMANLPKIQAFKTWIMDQARAFVR
jgi:LysR family glycine cleavage system transcriptional activator